MIGASTAGDTIRVVPVGKQTGALSDTVKVLINGVSQGTFTGFNRIAIYGQDGNDDLQVDGAVKKDACIYGRGGNDRLRGAAATISW